MAAFASFILSLKFMTTPLELSTSYQQMKAIFTLEPSLPALKSQHGTLKFKPSRHRTRNQSMGKILKPEFETPAFL